MKKPLLVDGVNAVKPNGALVYAKNKVFDKLYKNIRNEDGFKAVTNRDANVVICGHIETPNKLVIFTLSTNTNISSIYTLTENGTGYDYETVLISPFSTVYNTLNFNIDNPIQGTFTLNIKGEIEIAFIEGVKTGANSVRYLNIDNVGFPLNSSNMAVDFSDYEGLNSNQSLTIPAIDFVGVINGGLLPIGEYTIHIAYTDESNNTTNFISSLNPITIYEKAYSYPNYLEVFDDDDLDTIANKSIVLNLTNLDNKFNKVTVGIVHQINGNKVAYVQEVHYSNAQIRVVINEVINLPVVDINEIVVDNAIIHKSNSITTFDNELLLGNVTTQPRVDYSQVACDIVVKANTSFEPQSSIDEVIHGNTVYFDKTFKSNKAIVESKIFQFDEVYALYITPIYKSGERAEAFHIPGMAMPESVISITSANGATTADFHKYARLFVGAGTGDESDVDNIDVNTYTQFIELEKMNVGNVKLFQIRNFGYNGTMSPWENQNEVYETGHPFAGQKVRHHKTPSYKNILGTNSSNNEYQKKSIRLELYNIDFSAYPEIQGYEISIAHRSQLNKTVVDEVALYNGFKVKEAATAGISDVSHISPAVITNELYDIDYGTTTDVYSAIAGIRAATNKDVFAYAPQTMKNNDPLVARYLTITNIFQFNTDAYQDNNLYPDDLENKRNFNYIDTFEEILYDATESADIIAIFDNPEVVIDEQVLIVQDGKYNDVYLHRSQSAIYMKLKDTFKCISNDVDDDMIEDRPIGISDLTHIPELVSKNIYAKAQMRQYFEDVYLDYSNQKILKVYQSETTSLNCTITGDTFVSSVAMRVGNRRTNTVCILPYNSTLNFELRTPTDKVQDIETVSTPMEDNYWRPNPTFFADGETRMYRSPYDIGYYTGARHKWLGKYNSAIEYWGVGIRSIKSDWSLMGNGKVAIGYNYNSNYVSEFPYRVFKSLPMQSESLTNAWRIFPPTSYSDVENEKGKIQTLDTLGQGVYCRQEFALMIYSVIATMDVVDATVALGTHGVFYNKPREISSDELGYIGSNSRFNSLVTPFGYFIIDVVKKEVYKVTGVTAQPISLGVSEYIAKRFDSTKQNPYNEGDVVLGYNDKDKMILLTNSDNILNINEFTLSYPIYNDAMFSFHTYIGNIYARTRLNLFSLTNVRANRLTSIYQHNDEDTKCLYYYNQNGTRDENDDVIDLLFNDDKQYTNKLLEFVTWSTQSEIKEDMGNNIRTLDEVTVDKILVYSDTQATKINEIDPLNKDWYETKYGRNIQNTWLYNDVLDSVWKPFNVIIKSDFELNTANIIDKDYYDMSNFIGTFAVVRLIHENKAIDNYGTVGYVKQYITIVDVKFTDDKR